MIPQIGPFDVKAVFPNAVRSATVRSAEFDMIDYAGKGLAILDAAAQGSGITSTIKFQTSPPLEQGSNYLTTGDADKKLNIATGGMTKLAVKFTQSGARQIKTVSVRLKRTGTIAADKILTLTIETDTTGAPSGTAIGTAATILAASIGTSYEWVTFTFAVPVDLATATVYHIVLTSNYTASDTNYISWHAFTVSSDGNCENYNGSAWAAVATLNLMYYARQYNFADITGAAFTGVGNTASQQVKVINIDRGRYIRAVDTVAGGSATGGTSVSLALRKKDMA